MSTVKWFETAVPTDLEVRQVYGFLFGLDGRILVSEATSAAFGTK